MKFIFLILVTLIQLALQLVPVSVARSSYASEETTTWITNDKKEKSFPVKETKTITLEDEK